MEKKEHWNSRFAFVMAAIGSAVGLGNVWRFPFVCYESGGGAFLIPFFVALFTAGIPLMILELSLGHWARYAPPQAFQKIGKKWEWTGWLIALSPFIIAIYYVVVMSWCFCYMIYSLDLRWGSHAEEFFHNFLADTGTPTVLGSISIPVILGLLVIWLCVFLILYKGVSRIGKVVAITVPLPTILLIILTVRGLTLPGAMDGISYYLTPDFSKLGDVNVWLAAYAQVFFSLSIAQGIMITYASFLKKKSDITNNAFIISLADAGTSFLAGFTVFSVVGYLAQTQGLTIPELGLRIAGPNLTFITYPTAISLLPVAASFFGIIFYIALLTFGIDSAFSMIEPFTASITNKWHLKKAKATALICLSGFLLSLLFATGAGLHWLDIVDHFIANFGLVTIGLLECIILGWLFRLATFREHVNKSSDIQIGKWWDTLVKYVVPLILIIILSVALYQNITDPYLNYPLWVLVLGGILPLAGLVILAVFLMKIRPAQEEQV
ncbi:MAG: sodium-dependent transporter [Candidatus Thermoplasmatota archaeon]|nr:sodium-dependent transporter [Candidatus Thermoplasmatota archaeon]MBU1940222.1 sodium-dependent transporter [Candidatus Thermoplasmatota archaeon]